VVCVTKNTADHSGRPDVEDLEMLQGWTSVDKVHSTSDKSGCRRFQYVLKDSICPGRSLVVVKAVEAKKGGKSYVYAATEDVGGGAIKNVNAAKAWIQRHFLSGATAQERGTPVSLKKSGPMLEAMFWGDGELAQRALGNPQRGEMHCSHEWVLKLAAGLQGDGELGVAGQCCSRGWDAEWRRREQCERG
jgi:hypothetical protein